jgi:DNA-binding NarL/FixJ family response regulator
MDVKLTDKKILIVEGSMLSTAELREAFVEAGAQVYVTGKILTAFDMLNRHAFDGVVVDQGMHNEAFDLCEELRDQRVPFICCNAPHRLQGLSARRNDAEFAAWRLASMIVSRDDLIEAHMSPRSGTPEVRTS